MDISIRRIWLTLLVCVLACVAMGTVGDVYREATAGRASRGGLVALVFKQFDLNDEANLPTWLASALFVLAAALAAITARVAARVAPREALPWAGVALAFCYFSLDETARIHEQINALLHYVVGMPGGVDLLSLALAIGVGGLLLPFVLRLDRPTRNALVLSAVLFVTGAAGIEVVTNKVLGLSGEQIRAALVVTPVEELLEMLAALIFIRALLRRLAAGGPTLQVHFVDSVRSQAR